MIAIWVDNVPTPGLFMRATTSTNLDGWEVGCPVGRFETPSDGLRDGLEEGCPVGCPVGLEEGLLVGFGENSVVSHLIIDKELRALLRKRMIGLSIAVTYKK